MDHFGVAGGAYTVAAADPIVYHSQLRQSVARAALPVRVVVLGGTAGQPVDLYYRHHGTGGYAIVPMVPNGTRGGYRAEVPAADVTPDGVDYFVRAGTASTFEPRLAASGAVAHAVAVFMPEVPAAPAPPAPAPVPAPTPAPPTRTLPATGIEVWWAIALAALGLSLAGRRLATRAR